MELSETTKTDLTKNGFIIPPHINKFIQIRNVKLCINIAFHFLYFFCTTILHNDSIFYFYTDMKVTIHRKGSNIIYLFTIYLRLFVLYIYLRSFISSFRFICEFLFHKCRVGLFSLGMSRKITKIPSFMDS